MAHHYFKQPHPPDTWAIYSTITDDLIAINMTSEDVQNYEASLVVESTKEHVKKTLEGIAAGDKWCLHWRADIDWEKARAKFIKELGLPIP